MKRICITLCLALMGVMAMRGETIASSPDGRIVVDFEVKEGRPMYSVLYDGQVAIAPSALGVQTNMGDYTSDLTWPPPRFTRESFPAPTHCQVSRWAQCMPIYTIVVP